MKCLLMRVDAINYIEGHGLTSIPTTTIYYFFQLLLRQSRDNLAFRVYRPPFPTKQKGVAVFQHSWHQKYNSMLMNKRMKSEIMIVKAR